MWCLSQASSFLRLYHLICHSGFKPTQANGILCHQYLSTCLFPSLPQGTQPLAAHCSQHFPLGVQSRLNIKHPLFPHLLQFCLTLSSKKFPVRCFLVMTSEDSSLPPEIPFSRCTADHTPAFDESLTLLDRSCCWTIVSSKGKAS